MIINNYFINIAHKRWNESFLHSSIYRFVFAALVGLLNFQHYANTKRKEHPTATMLS